LRKPLAIFLLVLLPFQWTAAPALARQKQLNFKKQFKKWLREHWQELPVQTFSGEILEQVSWIEPHEFEYRGDMYDVVNENTGEDGKRSLVCVKDDMEKKLKKQFRSCAGGKGKYPADTSFSVYALSDSFRIAIRHSCEEISYTPYFPVFSRKEIRSSFRPPELRIYIIASLYQG